LHELIVIILRSLWFLGPGGIANGTPTFAARLFPKFEYPMDFNLTFRGKRIFGDHKTIRGLLSGIFTSIIFTYFLVYVCGGLIPKLGLLDFSQSPLIYGFLSGTGALLGDAVKSFFKRQLNIEPGKSWFFFDQADWIIGLLITFMWYTELSWGFVINTLIIGISLHLVFRLFGFLFGIVREII
jgi:CDP-2,3-bis-(O-geranylgeranyl)-sn-glycerol synthase